MVLKTKTMRIMIWLSVFSSIIGIFFNYEKNYLCWYFYTFSSIIGFYYFLKLKEYAMVVMNTIYIILNLWGLYKWTI